MLASVRTIRLIGRAKVKQGRREVVTAVYEALWPITCMSCAYTIQPGEWFTRLPKQRGDLPTEPVCRHCRPFAGVKVRTVVL
jgi:hypothetical protein